MKLELSNVSINNGTTKCDNGRDICDVSAANVTLVLSNVRKQITKLLNVIKLRAYVMLVLSNMSKKRKEKGNYRI